MPLVFDPGEAYQFDWSHEYAVVACTPGAGWEKGQVESQMGHVRGRMFVPRTRGRSYAEINARLEDQCIAEAKRPPPKHRWKPCSRRFSI